MSKRDKAREMIDKSVDKAKEAVDEAADRVGEGVEGVLDAARKLGKRVKKVGAGIEKRSK